MGKTITAFVVDDEANSRDILVQMLSFDKDIQVLGASENIDQAMQAVREHNPDILFLDIEMPGGSGFELLERLRKTPYNPAVIFITAYNQFAIKAIKYAAFDYLLKPIDLDDLVDTLDRYKVNIDRGTMKAKADKLLSCLPEFRKLKFSMRRGIIFIEPEEITWCEACGSYTILHFHSRKDEVVSVSLKDVESQMEGLPFLRVSRSAIINLKYLAGIDRRNKQCIVQKGDKTYRVPGTNSILKILEAR
ncbi:MAG TPA: LytTR family DNA-binding domain-containing protein [Tenuifilaceae bacterium]|nr:LytTR family DNA-binding domain-containing protein [Tenuifilaceae bacterium]HPW27282.1 LytTR family DNA-binding domain-containing protein [Tenuifilaceae bacterium]HQM05686.1 LytTR family DNA-binding domain-containing protein [Tenuifilaceae bacterium]HRC94293.1 LytTR family DNA-binding domain-containing protein [Tenuifilaceae bacterium]